MSEWRVSGASVPGTSHLARQQPCQDAFAAHREGECLVLAASDGAGSARLAHLGSRAACDHFVRIARDHLHRDDLDLDLDAARTLLAGVREALQDEASATNASPRDLACTLLGVIVTPRWTSYLQVGDGVIVTEDDSEVTPVFWPANGEYVNETHFILDGERHLRFRTNSRPPRRVALLTDGLQPIALRLAERAAHAPFFRPLFEAFAATTPGEEDDFSLALARFLSSDPVRRRTDDDTTIVLALTDDPRPPDSTSEDTAP